MPEWLVIVGALGLTHLWTGSYILAPVRRLVNAKLTGPMLILSTCTQCLSFWVALLVAIIAYPSKPGLALLLAAGTSFFGLIEISE